MNKNFIDMTGRRFGKLIVISRAPDDKSGNKYWKCLCDCGTEKVIAGGSLRGGISRSCGCLRVEVKTKHGYCGTQVYKAWESMKARCQCVTDARYPGYGGRGIKTCDRWQTFENFLADMGEPPTKKHSLDRFPDFNGNYEPSNCRWATMKEQQVNKRTNHRITIRGETKSIAEWSAISGVHAGTILGRLTLQNRTPEDAVFGEAGDLGKKILCRGEEKTIGEWSKISGVPSKHIDGRIREGGWDPEKAIFTPVKFRTKNRKVPQCGS